MIFSWFGDKVMKFDENSTNVVRKFKLETINNNQNFVVWITNVLDFPWLGAIWAQIDVNYWNWSMELKTKLDSIFGFFTEWIKFIITENAVYIDDSALWNDFIDTLWIWMQLPQ